VIRPDRRIPRWTPLPWTASPTRWFGSWLTGGAVMATSDLLRLKSDENHVAEIKIRAERRAGELLAEMELKPGRPKAGNTATLAALEIDEHDSRRWQQIASVPKDRFEAPPQIRQPDGFGCR
jgi:hypothetical protein